MSEKKLRHVGGNERWAREDRDLPFEDRPGKYRKLRGGVSKGQPHHAQPTARQAGESKEKALQVRENRVDWRGRHEEWDSSGKAVLKSYSANRFDVCMVGIVADGVCGSSEELGSARILRTDREMRGEIAHKS